ncbi:MAG: hypothetical protein AB7E61_06465 [Acholeplasmataceae bacterium]
MENMQKDLKDYEKIFISMGKSKEFEINIDFIKSLVDTKKRIADLEGFQLIMVNKSNPTIQKPTEAAKLLIKLKKIEIEQTKIINKILGISLASTQKRNNSSRSNDFVDDFKKQYNIE